MSVKRVLLRIGQLLLIAAVTYGIVRALAPEISKVSIDDFRRWQPQLGLLLLATLMLIVVYTTHCFLWRTITTSLGGIKPGLKSSLRIYFVSSLGRYIPGKLWQIAGMAMLAQKAGISPVAATAASLAAQFAFLTTGLVYLALLLPGWGGGTPIIVAAALLVAGAAGFFVFTATRLGHDIRQWLTRRFGQRFGDALMLLDRIDWRHALVWWFAYALTWALLGAAFVLFVSAFVHIDPTQRIQVAGIIAVSYLGGYLAFFSFAGLGIREAVMFGLLTCPPWSPQCTPPLMPAAAALVISVASRVWFTAAELLPLAAIPLTSDRRA